MSALAPARLRRQAATLAALAGLTALAACSEGEPQARTESAPSTGSTVGTNPDLAFAELGQEHLWGPGRWGMRLHGDPGAPLAVFDVPVGWEGRERFVWTGGDLDVGAYPAQLLYESPTRVLLDPCAASRASRKPGPTVQDLADALVAQERTTTTRPVPTVLDGYRGLYLELTTPLGPAFRTSCRGGVVPFLSGRGFERVHELPVTDHYWILDVSGRRVVLSASTPVGARPELLARITDVVEAVVFVADG